MSHLIKDWLGTTHEIEFLIQPYMGKDPRFTQIIRKLSSALQKTEDVVVQEVIRDSCFRLRFELPGVQVVANDVLPVRYTIRLPRDDSNNVVVDYIQLHYIGLTAKVAPVTDFIMDCLVSTDKGANFKSLFGQDNSLKPTLPGGLSMYKNTFFSVDRLFDENMLRLDVLVADGTVDGIEFDMVGSYEEALPAS